MNFAQAPVMQARLAVALTLEWRRPAGCRAWAGDEGAQWCRRIDPRRLEWIDIGRYLQKPANA